MRQSFLTSSIHRRRAEPGPPTRAQGRLAALVRAALQTHLTFEEAEVVRLRYGLDGAGQVEEVPAIADRLAIPFVVALRRLRSAERKLGAIPLLRRAVLA